MQLPMIYRELRAVHTEQDGGSLVIAKIVAMSVLFLISFSLGSMPIKLSQWFKWSSDARNNTFVKLILCLGGGILMCTTFIHLIPEISENAENLEMFKDLKIPIAETFTCMGFFIIFFVEQCLHMYLERGQKKQDFKTIRRSLSIRRGEVSSFVDVEKGERKEDSHPNIHECNHGHIHVDDHGDHSHIIIDDKKLLGYKFFHIDLSSDNGFDNTQLNNKSLVPKPSHGDNHNEVLSDAILLANVRGLLVVFALSIHELFEGLAVGLESSVSNVWYMFGAVSAHKFVIAFCIGVELVTSGLKNKLILLYVFIFAVVSPLGIGIGIAITEKSENSTEMLSVMLQGVASGTLLYIVFFEILKDERKEGMKEYFAILAGFVIMYVITYLSD